jgi:DNA (cytosine-5)-methyltransferase 1
MNYYNDIDPFCAQWLRNLVKERLIPHGVVDDTSIEKLSANDLKHYRQCHFFAGIAGWSRALSFADWPEHRQVWTGSCPCQPFSLVGQQKGLEDVRHIWPAWFNLIKKCRPPIVFGEQVAAAQLWLDGVCADLESEDYAFGSAVLPAASVGAPHKRDRIWFVAMADTDGISKRKPGQKSLSVAHRRNARLDPGRRGKRLHDGTTASPVADTESELLDRQGDGTKTARRRKPADSGWWSVEPCVGRMADGVPGRVGKLRALGNAIVPQVAAEFIKAAM